MAVLEARGVSFAYPGGARVLEGVSLRVASCERVALSAPSGFGKSTLCQVLAGYLAPEGGAVTLDGRPFAARAGTPCPVQLIWQHPERAVDPYLRLGATVAEGGKAPASLMEALGIRPEWLSRFPHELSGGELQRCCIARALAARPRFIIADEISTMLDAITQVQIWEFLLAYCARHDVGLVMVTHSPALQAQLATRVVDLTAGSKRAGG